MVAIAPYGQWRTPLDVKAMFERPAAPMHPRCHDGKLYWLESRPGEGGRIVLVRREADGSKTCLTPAEFNIRTRVHEYGGQCFAFARDQFIFSNFSDQRLYSQPLTGVGPPRPLTRERPLGGPLHMYADLQVCPDRQFLICVTECDHAEGENHNALALIELGGDETHEPVVLVEGHDFFANPVLAPDSRKLAWLQWDHPDMPWDATEAWVGELAPTPLGWRVRDRRYVAGGEGQAVCQLAWSPGGTLFFARDREPAEETTDDFWNLYALRDGIIEQVTRDRADYGTAHWVFGDTRYVFVADHELAAVRTRQGQDELVRVDTATGATRHLGGPYTDIAQLSLAADPGGGDQVLMVAGCPDAEHTVVALRLADDDFVVLDQPQPLLRPEFISMPEPVSYPTTGGDRSHAFFYPPRNPHFQGPAESHPPVIVFVHGGPTSRTTTALSWLRQYWTTLGFAVVDVNHRGSTGYGRSYRQGLRSNWGMMDADDVVAAIRYLSEQELIDPERVLIRGGSAGGYAVLRLLTEHGEVFRAGASYYGIGNLITLARLTHKFEAHYLDSLLGETFEPERAALRTSPYHQRSPIFFMDRLERPLILFQGLDDKVVPPALSQEVAELLARRGIRYEYVEYPGEGHGFRRADTRVDALRKETAFFIAAITSVDHAQ